MEQHEKARLFCFMDSNRCGISPDCHLNRKLQLYVQTFAIKKPTDFFKSLKALFFMSLNRCVSSCLSKFFKNTPESHYCKRHLISLFDSVLSKLRWQNKKYLMKVGECSRGINVTQNKKNIVRILWALHRCFKNHCWLFNNRVSKNVQKYIIDPV